MTKQVKTPQDADQQSPKNLYIRVDTFDQEGKTVGTRIVDMYHPGTRNWLQGHTWWAMHNSNTIEQTPALVAEVEEHLAAQRQALADKFNTKAA